MKIVQPKEISMQLMLAMNEHFDDNLLQDVVEMIDYSVWIIKRENKYLRLIYEEKTFDNEDLSRIVYEIILLINIVSKVIIDNK